MAQEKEWGGVWPAYVLLRQLHFWRKTRFTFAANAHTWWGVRTGDIWIRSFWPSYNTWYPEEVDWRGWVESDCGGTGLNSVAWISLFAHHYWLCQKGSDWLTCWFCEKVEKSNPGRNTMSRTDYYVARQVRGKGIKLDKVSSPDAWYFSVWLRAAREQDLCLSFKTTV